MRRQSYESEINRLQTALRNENFRYHLALKDGAVNSITKEVLEKIHRLETEITLYRAKSEFSQPESIEFSSPGPESSNELTR